MTEGVMSARVLPSREQTQDVRHSAGAEVETCRRPAPWNPGNFAREQIEGLVRQVFISDALRPIRQVVFSAADESDLRKLCRALGEALAAQTQEAVAVVGGYPRLLRPAATQPPDRMTNDASMPLRQVAARLRGNLWLVPDGRTDRDSVTPASLHAYMAEVRRQFEYSIVEAPCTASGEAAALAQFADGIVLVLSEGHTRRAAAGQIKAALEAAQVRILGAVLSDRMFPIPDALYRRL